MGLDLGRTGLVRPAHIHISLIFNKFTIHNELVQKLGYFEFIYARMAKVMMRKFEKYWKNYN